MGCDALGFSPTKIRFLLRAFCFRTVIFSHPWVYTGCSSQNVKAKGQLNLKVKNRVFTQCVPRGHDGNRGFHSVDIFEVEMKSFTIMLSAIIFRDNVHMLAPTTEYAESA